MEPVLWFGWFRADIIAEYAELFWQGLRMTVGITVIGIVQGALLGLLVGMARLADARHAPARQVCRYLLRWPATVYVSFFRGTPLFVQIMLIHFAVVPLLVNPTDGLLISGDMARDLRQEGLTNVLKHARASDADVIVRYRPDEVEIEVRDNGGGASASDGLGHGLVGIRERVKIYGGEMSARAEPEGGFVLSTRLPVVEESA